MATKPTPGGSDGTYGTELNAFLDVSLASDGKVKDGAVFSTSAAPTVDAGVANQKYVDDNIPVGDTPTIKDSTNANFAKTHAYRTQTAGFVTAWAAGTANELKGFVHTTNNPAGAGTQVAQSQTDGASDPFISFFVGFESTTGIFFEVTQIGATTTILWTPLISGGAAPIDQD